MNSYSQLAEMLTAAAPSTLPSLEVLAGRAGQFAAMFQSYFRRARVRPRGVIHLGGNIGNDLVAWFMLGAEKLLVVEPNPSLHEQLARHVDFMNLVRQTVDGLLGMPSAEWIRIAKVGVGDADGSAVLHIPASGDHENASTLGIPARVREVQTVTVPIRKVDSIMAELASGWPPEDFNVLYANIEGAELLALKGARQTLKHIDFAYIEANTGPNFPGCPAPEDLIAFLADFGLQPFFRIGGEVRDTEYHVYSRLPAR